MRRGGHPTPSATRTTRFLVALVVGLGLVTWGASFLVRSTTLDWFERDLNLRSQLAVNSARQALARGKFHVSAVPVHVGEQAIGLVVLVHDLGFVERRDAKAQRFLLAAFGFLARFGQGSYRPVVLLRAHHEPPNVLLTGRLAVPLRLTTGSP